MEVECGPVEFPYPRGSLFKAGGAGGLQIKREEDHREADADDGKLIEQVEIMRRSVWWKAVVVAEKV
jgi:hypothetical protein